MKGLEQIRADERRLEATRSRDENEKRIALWDAINAYVRACGGDPNSHVLGNTPRQRAVIAVERLVFPRGVRQ